MPPDDVSGTYDVMSRSYDPSGNPLVEVEEMVVSSLLRGLDFQDCLDAGCGTGRYALMLAAKGKHVAAVDSSEGMLSVVAREAEERGLSVDIRREDVTALSAASSSFDLVICALALTHVKDIEGACAELARVLRKGGHLIVSDLHPDIQALRGADWTIDVDGKRLAYPSYHGNVSDYVDAVEKAGCDLLAAIDVPMQQSVRGLATGALVVFARKHAQGQREALAHE